MYLFKEDVLAKGHSGNLLIFCLLICFFSESEINMAFKELNKFQGLGLV